MAETISPPKMLHKLKREEPFLPFEIITAGGARHSVSGRFRFGFNRQYVLVLGRRDIPVRVPFSEIEKIETQSSHATGH